MGAVRVPAAHYWGAQTQRSVEHFPIGTERFVWGRPVIRALGILKLAAARANEELGQLPADKAELIARAAQEVAAGDLDAEFPLVVFQTGSGTQSNMNANEVIANRANELAGAGRGADAPIHPNDHVNKGQSSNDTFPAVMHIAAVGELNGVLIPAVEELRDTLRAKAAEYADVVMIGRTHLQDAVPITLGQVIGGWVAQLDQALTTVRGTLPGVVPARAGRHSRRHRAQHTPALRGDRGAAHRRDHREPLPPGRRLRLGAVGARRSRQRQRGAAHPGRRLHEDRQRRALVRLGPPRRPRRAHHPRERAGIVDHAGQGEPHAGRGPHPGRGAGVRQRHRRRLRRLSGQLPAQRLQAGDAAQPARVGAAARGGRARLRPLLRARPPPRPASHPPPPARIR